MRINLTALLVLLAMLLSGVPWAEAGETGCIADIIDVTTAGAACKTALSVASTVCPLIVAMGLVDPATGSICAISVAVASWMCRVSPATIPALIWCFFV